MAHSPPGKHERSGVSLMDLMRLFPDEESARAWFEASKWPTGRYCPRCGSTNTHEAKHAKSPYRCRDCKKYFSVRTGSLMEGSNVPLLKWVFAIYLEATSLKGISSMKLHRDIDVTQKTAWFMLHRIREAWATSKNANFTGPAEADETYMGGLRKNMPKSKRKELFGQGRAGKVAVAGVKDRATNQVSAEVVEGTDRLTLQFFIEDRVINGAKVYTDEASAYKDMPYFEHEAVKHGAGEYVRGDVHTNGIESFWSMLKRAHKGTFHKISEKHLNRYIQQFAGKHNMRALDTIRQMQSIVAGMVGRRLRYPDLIR